MWAIYAVEFEDNTSIWNGEDKIIATFDTKKQAQSYINAARLKNPSKSYFNVFKHKSLLHYYEYASIEEYIPEPPPIHNPEIDW